MRVYRRDKRIKLARIRHDTLEQVSVPHILVFAASKSRSLPSVSVHSSHLPSRKRTSKLSPKTTSVKRSSRPIVAHSVSNSSIDHTVNQCSYRISRVSLMLLLQALLLLLLSISSMAIPVPGTATGLEPLPDKQKFPFFSVRDGNDEQAQKRDMFRFRGLWQRTAVSEHSSFHLTSYEPHILPCRLSVKRM